MKINKTRRRINGTISRRKHKNIYKSRKRIKKTHKKYLVRLKKYNKNIRHRKHYTRKVNRYKRGGADLQPITAEFNFSFPLMYDSASNLLVQDDNISKFTDGYEAENIIILAGGWGYVTKAGSLNGKNRREQLIVYKRSEDVNYYIARCTFSNCDIAKGGIPESNMEKPIKVSTEGFKVELSRNSLIVTFKNDKNESYTIEVFFRTGDETLTINYISGVPTLYAFFKTLLTPYEAAVAEADSQRRAADAEVERQHRAAAAADAAAAEVERQRKVDDAAAAAPFNFSLPTIDGKITDNYNTNFNNVVITPIAWGWGYVTKTGSLNRKNRPEQLIIYQKSYHEDTYYIARCTFKDCKISMNTFSAMKMEKPIIVEQKGFEVPEKSGYNLKVEFKNDKDESYTIEAVKSNRTDENLYRFFEYIRTNPNAATSARVAIQEKLAIGEKLGWDPVAANTQIT
jgi:hypothetical protein